MGIIASVPGRECLLSAVGGDSSRVAFQGGLLYQALVVHPFNFNWPVTPAAVTFPETSQEVANIVKCAADNNYKVQARSGGHSYGNYGLGGTDGAIVIDLKNFQQFSMDDATYQATIGPGTSLADVTTRLYDAGGRAMAHGICPSIGSGGHFTIGGLGPTSRQWGSSLDHIEEVEVVLSNSSIVRASSTENSDIFFAVKGAGAGFGIVTEFKVRTEPAPGVAVQYSYTFNLGSAAERANLLKDWQAFISDPKLTRRFASSIYVLEHSILMTGIFFGSKEEYGALGLEERFPISEPGNVVVLTDWLGMVGHGVEELVVGVGCSIPMGFYAKSMSFTPHSLIPASGFENLFNYLDTANKGTLTWLVRFDLQGGATNDIPTDATAYPHRDTLYWVMPYAFNLLGHVSETAIEFVDGVAKVIAESVPDAVSRAYPGYVDPLLPDAQRAYWRSNLPRLQEIKTAVDPDDVFHNPQSVQVVRS